MREARGSIPWFSTKLYERSEEYNSSKSMIPEEYDSLNVNCYLVVGQLVGPCGTDTCDCTSIVYSRDVVDVYLRIEDY